MAVVWLCPKIVWELLCIKAELHQWCDIFATIAGILYRLVPNQSQIVLLQLV